jgi:BirA family biotin operon repressor/biotin-[acetyl-CoA-carboxylase] ligase
VSDAAPSPWRLREHATLPSTQDAAMRAAKAGDPGRLAVLAHSQTAGRGSRGRGWLAPPGNLSMSVLLRPAAARPDPGHWAMLAGVALHDALAQWARGLMLKWPNDVLCHGAKLGGVLIECGLADDGCLDWVVIGLGANLAHAPTIEGRPTACLPAPAPAARDVARAVLGQLDTHARGDIRSAWLARAHPPGTALDVVTPRQRVRGRFAGLTPAGELLLEGHPHPIGSAEIFLPEERVPEEPVPCC